MKFASFLNLSFNIRIALAWLVLFMVSLLSRSFVPIDETRYVTVAWNMYQSGQYVVPYLNDIAYSHKPPLLFWLINLGWHLFGVSDWWARMVPAIFGLGAMLLTRSIALRLWPASTQSNGENKIAERAAWILLSTSIWAVFSTATMFDMMVAFFTTLGMLGLILAIQGLGLRAWGIFALAIAGGLLAKGPTILLQLLPVAILMPWVMATSWPYPSKRVWYGPLFFATLAGILILLMWAIPAGILGGAQYQHEIFWGQTAERMVNSFAHQRPIYWYLQMSIVILFPWIWLGQSWRSWTHAWQSRQQASVRFCWVWALPVLFAFSLISGKQMHYLLPILPALSLLLAFGWQGVADSKSANHHDKELFSWGSLALSGMVFAVGLALLNIQELSGQHRLPAWVLAIQPWVAWSLLLSALWYQIANPLRPKDLFVRSSMLGILLFVIGMTGVVRATGQAYDMRGISAYLGKLEQSGVALGNVGDYHGQYNFIGRLKRSPEKLEEKQVMAWFQRHPQGRIVIYLDNFDLGNIQPEYTQLYRGISLAVIDQAQWQAWLEQRSHRRKAAQHKKSEDMNAD